MDSVTDASPGRLAATGSEPVQEKDSAALSRLPLWRLNLLRVGYFLLAVGLAVVEWPEIIRHHSPWPLMEGVVNCMLGAISLLAFVGLRYPVQMLPLLLFESAWKLIWLTVVALPLWRTQQLDAATREITYSCLWVVIILAVIPWRYVYSHYLAKRGDPWR